MDEMKGLKIPLNNIIHILTEYLKKYLKNALLVLNLFHIET